MVAEFDLHGIYIKAVHIKYGHQTCYSTIHVRLSLAADNTTCCVSLAKRQIGRHLGVLSETSSNVNLNFTDVLSSSMNRLNYPRNVSIFIIHVMNASEQSLMSVTRSKHCRYLCNYNGGHSFRLRSMIINRCPMMTTTFCMQT